LLCQQRLVNCSGDIVMDILLKQGSTILPKPEMPMEVSNKSRASRKWCHKLRKFMCAKREKKINFQFESFQDVEFFLKLVTKLSHHSTICFFIFPITKMFTKIIFQIAKFLELQDISKKTLNNNNVWIRTNHAFDDVNKPNAQAHRTSDFKLEQSSGKFSAIPSVRIGDLKPAKASDRELDGRTLHSELSWIYFWTT
jgi:hypothetical protein